jgi:hypothetical protein
MYQLVAALKDFRAMRAGAILLAAQVLLSALSLGVTLSDLVQSRGNVATAALLDEQSAHYFSLYYDDNRRAEYPLPLTRYLDARFDGETADYTLLKNNYVPPVATPHRVLIAMGGFGQAYGFYRHRVAHDVALVGSSVRDVSVGKATRLTGSEVPIVRRLPAGAAYLDPWEGYVNLDDTIVILTTYGRFAAESDRAGVTPAADTDEPWREESLGRAMLFTRTPSSIDRYVHAARLTGALSVIPHTVKQKSQTDYNRQQSLSILFVAFFSALAAAMLISIAASLRGITRRKLRSYAIERMHGATLLHIILRQQLFLAAVFLMPTICIFAVLSLALAALQAAFPSILAVAVGAQLLVSGSSLRQLIRMDVSELLHVEGQ